MGADRKRLTLDLDPLFQRRLKARAALQGVTMREYCLAAIEQQLAEDEREATIPSEADPSDLAANGSS